MMLNLFSSSRNRDISQALLSILSEDVRSSHVDLTRAKGKAKRSKRRASPSATPSHRCAVTPIDNQEKSNETDDNVGLLQMCQCCYTEQEIVYITSCPSNHPFCVSCLDSYAAVELSQLSCQLRCIAAISDSSSGPCNLLLPDATLKSSLSPKLYSLYERVVQLKQVEEAELNGLEACPFCEFKMEFDESYTDTRFRCMNTDECGVVSCRGCRKKNHWPVDCTDVNDNTQHAVEEAMSNALKRTCPKCATSFVKDAGCNKMMCTRCSALVCYVCRQDISTIRYEHFQQPGDPNTIDRCPLYDKNGDVNAVHEEEVKRAEASAYAQIHASKMLKSPIQHPRQLLSSTYFDNKNEEEEAATKLERLDQWIHNVNRIAKGAEGGFELVGAGLIFEDESEEPDIHPSPALNSACGTTRVSAYPVHTNNHEKAHGGIPNRYQLGTSSGWTIEIIPFHCNDKERDTTGISSYRREPSSHNAT